MVLLADTLEIFDVGGNPVFTEGSTFNSYLGQLTQLTDLRYDQANFINTQGIPTELGLLKRLRFYNCAETLYSGPLNGAAFPSDQAMGESLHNALRACSVSFATQLCLPLPYRIP